MWSARISSTHASDPLEQYHATLRRHEALVRPRLDRLRRDVDATLSELRRQEAQHLSRQRQALAELRAHLAEDARFVLRSLPFALFAERLLDGSSRLPPPLRVLLPRDPSSWALGSLPLALQLLSCSLLQEPGYEEEHDCLRDFLQWKLHMGPLQAEVRVERGHRSLGEGFREVPLVYQHQELTFALEEHLQKLDLGESIARTLSWEVAAVALHAAPMFLNEPEGASFSYP
ncbi:MAG: hypothetical protein MUF64_28065 [Polyangiaceae bacterium]|nr:hypothetical protein [Polyangiaceae bacterium]